MTVSLTAFRAGRDGLQQLLVDVGPQRVTEPGGAVCAQRFQRLSTFVETPDRHAPRVRLKRDCRLEARGRTHSSPSSRTTPSRASISAASNGEVGSSGDRSFCSLQLVTCTRARRRGRTVICSATE